MKQINQLNRVCSMRPATNTRYTLFLYDQICYLMFVMSGTLVVPPFLSGITKVWRTVITKGLSSQVCGQCTLGCTHSESEWVKGHSRYNILTAPHEPYNIAWIEVWCTDCTHLCLGQKHAVHLCVPCPSTQQRPPAGYHYRTPSHIHSSSVGLWRDLKPSPAPTDMNGGSAYIGCCDWTHRHTRQTQTDMTPPLRMQCPTVQVVGCHGLVSAPIAQWRCQTFQVFVLAPVASSLTQPTHPTHVAYCPQQQQHVQLWAVVHSRCDEEKP